MLYNIYDKGLIKHYGSGAWIIINEGSGDRTSNMTAQY